MAARGLPSQVAPASPLATALLVLPACAVLLAGCGASLQNELAASSGQAGVAPTVATNGAGAPVTTGATPAEPVSEPLRDSEPASRVAAASKPMGAGASDAGADALPVKKVALSRPSDMGTAREAPPATVRLPSSAKGFTSMTEPGHVAYRIGPLDVLTITVFRVPELSTTVQVADTGTIGLPLIGEVPASGRTAQEVEQDVTARLGEKYLQNPQVTVFIKEYNARRVTVDGSVKKPGVYPLRGRTSLLQAITMAEGLDNNRASGDVVVFRQIDGKRTAARFDLDEIRAGTAPDPVVEPGDVVIVDDSAAKVVLHNVLRVLPVTNVFMGIF